LFFKKWHIMSFYSYCGAKLHICNFSLDKESDMTHSRIVCLEQQFPVVVYCVKITCCTSNIPRCLICNLTGKKSNGWFNLCKYHRQTFWLFLKLQHIGSTTTFYNYCSQAILTRFQGHSSWSPLFFFFLSSFKKYIPRSEANTLFIRCCIPYFLLRQSGQSPSDSGFRRCRSVVTTVITLSNIY
jgi:hypothetical protein